MTKRERIAAYLEAARRIVEHNAPWYVINELVEHLENASYCSACEWQNMFGNYLTWNSEPTELAALAYCLAAEMVRTGDL